MFKCHGVVVDEGLQCNVLSSSTFCSQFTAP